MKARDGFKYQYQLRTGNCLAVFIAKYKDETCKRGEYLYRFTGGFYADEKHLANIVKDGSDPVPFYDEVQSIRLNMYYKACHTLLKYYTKYGYKVTCYYEEPKEK